MWPSSARAQDALLVAASDPKLVTEVQLAQVMADDSSLWLSVHANGRARLALVSAASSVETTPSSDTWLRALDFTTRVHVAPPPGPLAACPNQTSFPVADSGLPESDVTAANLVTSVDSELELERSLANAGISVDTSVLDTFSVDATPPFQISWFEVGSGGGNSSALRLLDHGHPGQLPKIRIAGLDSVPLSLIALARDAVQPVGQELADPSDFAVTYFAADGDTDYVSARASWLTANADRWLLEAAQSPVLFDGTFARAAALDSVKDDLAESVRELGVDQIRIVAPCSDRSRPQAPRFASRRAHAETRWSWPPTSIRRTVRRLPSACRSLVFRGQTSPLRRAHPRSRQSIRAASRPRSSSPPVTTRLTLTGPT